MDTLLFDAVAAIAKILFVWAVVLAALLPNLVLLERRGAALIQDRPGPNRVGPFGLFQALADVVKMFMKEDMVPLYADRLLYNLAPLITMIPALTTFAVIPFGSSIPVTIGGVTHIIPLVIADVNVGILYVFALTSLGVYGLVLAGWSSNDKFSLMGGIRSSAQIISYELAMGIAAIGVFLAAGSLRLPAVVAYQHHGTFLGFLPHWNCFPQLIGCVIFVVSAFAETNRLPFDLAEAEAELVAGFHTEYSAFKFGMFFMGEYANMVAASALIVTLYFGGWSLPGLALTGLWGGLASIAIFAVKTFFFIWLFIWVRWTLPRFRYDQLMAIGWKVFLPLSLLNLLWTGWLVLASGGRV
jgi:NADH-quinone oxidoreductase subunit H